jgi:O-Antigen ligase
MTKVLLLLIGLGIAGPVIWGFAAWERQGKYIRATVLLLVLELVEAALYESENFVPRGIFHPGSNTTQLRLPEIFLALALIGRLVARRLPKRIGIPPILWVLWGAWMFTELIEGYLHLNPHATVLYDFKSVIYILGGFALASAVPVRDYLDAQVFEKLTRWSAPVAVLLDLAQARSQTFNLNVPLFPLQNFGQVGADAATMFGAVALITLMLELGKERRNVLTMACTIPLFLMAVVSGQRAALIGIAISIVFVMAISLGSTGRRRLRIHPSEIFVTVLAVIGVVLLVVIIPAIRNDAPIQLPFSSTISTEFNSAGKQDSAEDRVDESQIAYSLIHKELLFGSGLGTAYSYWSPGPDQYVTEATTDDIYLDLAIRTGVIGLGLFLVAMGVSLVDGLLVWRRHYDSMVAIFALALVAVILGLLVKGGVESILEKYRIATMLGLMLGMLRSAVTSAGEPQVFIPAALAARTVDEGV